MLPNQTLIKLTARAISAIDAYLTEQKPDMVVVQGDTTTYGIGLFSLFYNLYSVNASIGCRFRYLTGQRVLIWIPSDR